MALDQFYTDVKCFGSVYLTAVNTEVSSNKTATVNQNSTLVQKLKAPVVQCTKVSNKFNLNIQQNMF